MADGKPCQYLAFLQKYILRDINVLFRGKIQKTKVEK